MVKPTALTTFSTLDPLMTTNSNYEDIPDEGTTRRKPTFLSRAVRMLQGEPEETDEEAEFSTNASLTPPREAVSPPRSDAGEVTSAATTLSEGALPVRNFPNQLISLPAALPHSEASSTSNGDLRDSIQRRSSGFHKEELRCVIAIVRHGDRTPKQKLKVNMTCPQILKFFHKHVKDCHKDLKVKAKAPMTEFLRTVKSTLDEVKGTKNDTVRHHLLHIRDILERWKIVGLNRKLQVSFGDLIRSFLFL